MQYNTAAYFNDATSGDASKADLHFVIFAPQSWYDVTQSPPLQRSGPYTLTFHPQTSGSLPPVLGAAWRSFVQVNSTNVASKQVDPQTQELLTNAQGTSWSLGAPGSETIQVSRVSVNMSQFNGAPAGIAGIEIAFQNIDRASWNAVVSASDFSSITDSIVVNVSNGTYSFTSVPCFAGSFLNPSQSVAQGPWSYTCSPCLAGSAEPLAWMSGTGSCPSCSAGTFANESGATTCTLCPAGSVSSSGESSLACETCPANTFAPTEGSAACLPCLLGKTSEAGSTTCSLTPVPPQGLWLWSLILAECLALLLVVWAMRASKRKF